MSNFNESSWQLSSKSAENFDFMLLLLITARSSRVLEMSRIFANLRFKTIPRLPILVTTDMPSCLLDKSAAEHMIKRIMMGDIEYVEHLEALALQNQDKRIEYEKKLDEILAQPIPEGEYQKVCKEYPESISREKYLAIERAAAMLLLPSFTIDAQFLTLPQPMQTRIPEPVTLRWVDDIRRETAAKANPASAADQRN